MFGIRFFTPAVVDDQGWLHAGGEFVLGNGRLCFLSDLTHWRTREYEFQWRDAIARLVREAPSTALMTSYRGPGDVAHSMWALWRDDEYVWVQEHTVLAADLDAPFDPNDPYPHVGARIPAAEYGLPIREWRVELEHVHAAMLGIRLPKFPR